MTSLKTKIAQLAQEDREEYSLMNPSVQHASTLIFNKVQDLRAALKEPEKKPPYARAGVPVIQHFETLLAELEGGHNSVCTPSGLSAIALTLFTFLGAGDHILLVDNVYHGIRPLLQDMMTRQKVTWDFYDPYIEDEILDMIKPETKVIYLETPGSMTYELMNIQKIVSLVKKQRPDIIFVADNSWASPLFYNPFKDGVDVILHAVTKFIGGHGDLMLGAVVAKNRDLYVKLRQTYLLLGLCPAPDVVSQALKGIRTLDLRMKHGHESGIQLATYLSKRPEVKMVLHPAQPSSQNHQIWLSQFSGAAGLFTVMFDPIYSQAQIDRFLNSLNLFGIGQSWGGYRSLAMPLDLRYRKYRSAWQDEAGCMVRLYIGFEDPFDLMADLEQAMDKALAQGEADPASANITQLRLAV